jgi:hypothetical protein
MTEKERTIFFFFVFFALLRVYPRMRFFSLNPSIAVLAGFVRRKIPPEFYVTRIHIVFCGE